MRATLVTTSSLVSVVDDDESVRESLPDMLRQCGFAAAAFSSAEAFLASDVLGRTHCLILDVKMPGMSGPDLQRELATRKQEIPIVFVTERRQSDSSPPAIGWSRRMPVQALQRIGSPGRTPCRAADKVAIATVRILAPRDVVRSDETDSEISGLECRS
jgi:CheY-like chemotaxis protein